MAILDKITGLDNANEGDLEEGQNGSESNTLPQARRRAVRRDRISSPGRMSKNNRGHVDAEVLSELDRLRAELLANISQELRTPLTAIKGFASTLLQPDMHWSDVERRDFLESIEQETDRLNHLITGLLDVSRLENGALKLEKSEIQIYEMVKSIQEKLEVLTRHHSMHVKISSKLPTVYADPLRISQVIINLVQNATKFSKEGSPIILEAKQYHDQVVISIIDRGVGIPSQLQDKLFDRFYQVENMVSGRQGRVDIGLSICRGIIEAHGCKIWVESKVGEGSRFSFSLPVSKENLEKAISV